MSGTAELISLGFEESGYFQRQPGGLSLELPKHKAEKGCYAFVVGDSIRYVGVTKRSLLSRMYGYKNPGPTQQTNQRINPKIKGVRHVRVFFLPEYRILDFKLAISWESKEASIRTDLNLFERVLISLLCPPWNKA